jgi:hypothetical protein
MKNNETLIIKNERILYFFKNNQQLNIETVLINMIDLLEKMTLSSENNSSMLNNILSLLNNNASDTKNIISLINNNNEFIKIKMYEMKENYITEIRELLKNKDTENLLNINTLIDKTNSQLIDKINLLLSEKVSLKNNNELNLLIMKMRDELQNDKLSIDKISEIMDTKYNKILMIVNDNLVNTENRLSTNINLIKESSTKTELIQTQICDELLKYTNKNKVSSLKGLENENILFDLLTNELPSAEIINTCNKTGMGDFIIKRKDKQSILIETKNYNTNVKKEEVDKFIRDITNNNINGIFISQNTGIVGKDNFQIDIHNKNILIYIHSFNYDPTKIQLAISTIDKLNEKLINIETKNINIPNDLLLEINNEYQKHLLLKENMINNLKDYCKKTLDNFNDLELSSLDNFISKYYANNKKNNLICEICKKYETDNLKSMARHKQSCKNKKNEKVIESSSETQQEI